MKLRSLIIGGLALACSAGILLPKTVQAVDDAEFQALKKMVEQMNQKLQSLETTHQQDQTQINDLKRQLGETQNVATNAQTVATNAQASAEEAASKAQAAMTPPKNPSHNFMVVGDAEVQFGKIQGQHSAFVLADFAPIFLFRANENILFEAGFDVTLANNVNANGVPNGGSSTDVSLSFAQLDYAFNDYVTAVAGDMLLPLGTYSQRSAGWLNIIPDTPLPRNVLPGSGLGLQFLGAVPAGCSGGSFTYSAYGVNGPSSVNGTANADSLDLNGNVGDTGNLHANPSGGGRLGWFFPWKPRWDLELGVSGQSGSWDDASTRLWSAAVVDYALHLGPSFLVNGEYVNTWYGTDNSGSLRPHGVWVQAGYKLSGLGLELPVINNLELVGRYDNLNDALGTTTDRGTFGYVYYFSNTLWFEGDYETLSSRGPAALPGNRYIFQLSYGF